jgi:hypothetical protein
MSRGLHGAILASVALAASNTYNYPEALYSWCNLLNRKDVCVTFFPTTREPDDYTVGSCHVSIQEFGKGGLLNCTSCTPCYTEEDNNLGVILDCDSTDRMFTTDDCTVYVDFSDDIVSLGSKIFKAKFSLAMMLGLLFGVAFSI